MSDLEDDKHLKQFIEATDCNFFDNTMFKKNGNETFNDTKTIKSSDLKSQRYLDVSDSNTGLDINIPESVQDYISKKLSKKIQNQVEFCDLHCKTYSKKVYTSKIKLLKNAYSYVKPYEEFEYDSKGPSTKPVIKRRKLNNEVDLSVEEKIKASAVSFYDVIMDTKTWSTKPERRGKVFHYVRGTNFTLFAKEEPNEFSVLRRKNKWKESKIALR